MTNMYQGGIQGTPVLKSKPHPPIQALKQGSVGKTMSDLEFMQSNERKQHQQAYIYEYGHNDHGWGP
jgi:hypothetical protein